MINIGKIRRKLKQYYYRALCLFLNPKGSFADPYSDSPLKRRLTGIVPGSNNAAAFLRIYGDVTEVGYRGWLGRKARSNGLECSAKNNGKAIHALLIGSGEDIENVIREAWKGSARARVLKIKERWFNRPIKALAENLTGGKEKDPWSQEVADQVRRTIKYLEAIMKRPNQYIEVGRFSNASEIYRATANRNLFVIHQSNLNYVASPEKEVGFQNSLSSKITSVIRSVTDHKHLTKLLLNAHNLPVPKGAVFTSLRDAKHYLDTNSFPLVVKPVAGSYGRGISIDVRTQSELKTAWRYAKKYDDQIILEELIQGADIRILIVGGTACVALLRVPANVVGDGRSTIAMLIDQKNRERFSNPRLCKSPIIIDVRTESFLARQGYTLQSIPKKDEIVFLHLKANLEAGGDSIGVTEHIHPDLLKLAEEAAAVLGTDVYWGIDLMVERIDLPRDQQHCGVIEVNSRANIFNVQFPMYGRPADAAQTLVDYLFPKQWADLDYPLETRVAKITGMLGQEFLELALEKSSEYRISGSVNLAGDGSSAQIIASGRRHHLFFFLDSLWDWQDQTGLVDGLQISEYDGAVEEGFVVENCISDFAVGSSREKDLTSTVEVLVDSDPMAYPPVGDAETDSLDLNMQLFINELERCGYDARPLCEDLIEIKKEGSTGITGVYHSSIFCDTIFEKVIPAKKILSFHGLPVGSAARFKGRMRLKAIDYYERFAKDYVLTGLHPVEIQKEYVDNVEGLESAWKRARKKGTNNYTLEEQPQGWNVCIAVVAGQAPGALFIEPVGITGDGGSTIKQLIDEKNRLRRQNPYYKDKMIIVDEAFTERLERSGVQSTDRLPKGQSLLLESRACLELGGETIAAGDYLHDDFRIKAVEAVEAIPGLNFAFVHMVVPRPERPAGKQDWIISGVETEPLAALFHFPWKGSPCDVVGQVVTNLCIGGHTIWIKKRDGVE